MARFARVVCAAALCFSALAGCIQLEDFYSFGAAAGDSELDRGDDEHSEPLQLSRAFPYYDQQESQLYVSICKLIFFLFCFFCFVFFRICVSTLAILQLQHSNYKKLL